MENNANKELNKANNNRATCKKMKVNYLISKKKTEIIIIKLHFT